MLPPGEYPINKAKVTIADNWARRIIFDLSDEDIQALLDKDAFTTAGTEWYYPPSWLEPPFNRQKLVPKQKVPFDSLLAKLTTYLLTLAPQYKGAAAYDTALRGYHERLNAQHAQLKQIEERRSEIESMTNPDMSGFFPAYDPNARHAKRAFTTWDTETTDSHKIFDIFGMHLIWNIDAQQWELPKGYSKKRDVFHRVYVPKDFDKDVSASGLVHRIYNSKLVQLLRSRTGGKHQNYSTEWNLSEYESFKNFFKNTTQTGYNIVGADIPWAQMKNSEEYERSSWGAGAYKHPFLDAMHLVEAVYGKRRKLQDVAKELGISLESVAQARGINASTAGHMAAPDAVLSALVFQEVVRKNPDNPAVREFLKYMDSPYVHSQSPNKNIDILTDNLYSVYSFKKGQLQSAKFTKDVEGGLALTEDELEAWKEGRLSIDAIADSYQAWTQRELDMEDFKEMLTSLVQWTVGELQKGGLSPNFNGTYGAVKQHTSLSAAVDSSLRAILKDIKPFAGLPDKVVSDEKKAEILRILAAHGNIHPTEEFQNKIIDLAKVSNRTDAILANKAKLKGVEKRLREGSEYSSSREYRALKNVTEFDDVDTFTYAYDEMVKRVKEEKRKEASEKAALEKNYQAKIDAKESAIASGWLLREQIADPLYDTKESFKEYNEEIQKTIKFNRSMVAGLRAWSDVRVPDWTRQQEAAIQGVGEVGSAVGNLAPSFARRPINLLTTSGQQSMQAALANMKYQYWGAQQALRAAQAVGAGVSFANPILGATIGGVATLGSLGLNAWNERKVTEIQSSFHQLSSSINFVAAGMSALFAPLTLFRQGLHTTLGLFGKIKGLGLNAWGRANNIWQQQWGAPLTPLSGVTGRQYITSLFADTAFGLKQGSINNMANNWAFAQSNLYNSGEFDARRLIAASRLGVFNDVYGYTGDTQVQMASMIDKMVNRLEKLNPNSKDAKDIMTLINNIDPSMPAIVSRMLDFRKTGIYRGSYKDFANGSIWASKGLYFNPIKDRELTRFNWTASQWTAARSQMLTGLQRIAEPAWNSVGKPIYNIINRTLDNIAAELAGSGTIIEKMRRIGANFWATITEQFRIDTKDFKLGDVFGGFISSIQDIIKTGVGGGIIDAVKWILERIKGLEEGIINYMKVPLTNLFDYISDIEFKIEGNPVSGFRPVVHMPEEVRARRLEAATKIYDDSIRGWDVIKPHGAKMHTRQERELWNIIREAGGELNPEFVQSMNKGRNYQLSNEELQDLAWKQTVGTLSNEEIHSIILGATSLPVKQRLEWLSSKLPQLSRVSQVARVDANTLVYEKPIDAFTDSHKRVDPTIGGYADAMTASIETSANVVDKFLDALKNFGLTININDKTKSGVSTDVESPNEVGKILKQTANDFRLIFMKGAIPEGAR